MSITQSFVLVEGTLANPEHLAKLIEGVEPWNRWRTHDLEAKPDLSPLRPREAECGADLRGADLGGAHLRRANLRKADLREANLRGAHLGGADLTRAVLSRSNLCKADLHEADLTEANLTGADLTEAFLVRARLEGANLTGAHLRGAHLEGAHVGRADLRGANLRRARLSRTDLRQADLGGADLIQATLVGTNLEGANLAACWVHGISVWDVRLEGAIQSNLVITPPNESPIQVDNLEVAQFVYLLLNNEKIRDVIDTIGKRAVLILGRFIPERKAVLDAIREMLRHYGYLPILFDFEKPSTRDTQETIVTLAGMARFIIADISDPKSIPQELTSIVPNLPSVPVQPLLQRGYEPWGMYDHIKRYPWVLPLVLYENKETLLTEIEPKVFAPAEAKAKEQTGR